MRKQFFYIFWIQPKKIYHGFLIQNDDQINYYRNGERYYVFYVISKYR